MRVRGGEGRGRGVEGEAGAAYTLNPGMLVPGSVGALMGLQKPSVRR